MDAARRYVALMVVPLAVVAATLLVAVLVPYGYPVKWMTVTMPIEELSPFHALHVGAGILAVLIALAIRRGAEPGVLATVIALLSILAGTIMTAILVWFAYDEGYWTYVFAFTAPIVVALVIAFNALRMRSWQRMLGLLGALAIASLPYGCPLVPGMFNLFSGGLVFVLAELTILALFVRGMLAR